MSEQEVAAIFSAVDQDRSGAIDVEELQLALSKGGFVMSLTTVAQLIRLFDRNNDGKIDFSEFAGLHKFMGDAQTLFVAVAGSSTATQLTVDQLRRAVTQSGENLEPLDVSILE